MTLLGTCSSCNRVTPVLVVLRGPRGTEYGICRSCFCDGKQVAVKKGKR